MQTTYVDLRADREAFMSWGCVQYTWPFTGVFVWAIWDVSDLKGITITDLTHIHTHTPW